MSKLEEIKSRAVETKHMDELNGDVAADALADREWLIAEVERLEDEIDVQRVNLKGHAAQTLREALMRCQTMWDAERAKVERLKKTMRLVASCVSKFPGDVVSLARDALAETEDAP